MEILELEIPSELTDLKLPDRYEYAYWEGRKNRTFFIDYEIEGDYELVELAKTIILMNMEEKDIPKDELKPIRLFIHSFGGDVYQADSFADLVLSSRIPIYTIAMGVAMSSGFTIFLAGHKRYMFRHAQLLVHQGYAQFSGSADEIEQAQLNYKKQLESSKRYVLDRTGIDEKIFNKNQKKDWYLTAEEVEKYKIARVITNLDEII